MNIGRLVLLFYASLVCGKWSYLSGSQTIEARSNYTSPYAYPGGVQGHTMVLDSTDRYLYVFGGLGYDDSSSGRLNDLWKFDTLSNTWEYITGSQSTNTPSNYTSPYPGGVSNPTMALDSTGRYLYVFGGFGYDDSGLYGTLNDLWSYDILSSTWQHLFGSKSRYTPSNYTSPSQYPGGVQGHTMVLDSTDSYLYVFGGLGYDDSYSGWLNDLWKFDIISNTWEYITGNQTRNTLSSYTYSSAYPGGVYYHTMVLDSTERYLYVFGGYGFDDSSFEGYLNDLWKFDIMSSTWEHVSGNQSMSTPSNYISPYIYPGGVHGHTMVLDSTDSYLYVFGGGNSDSPLGYLNDLWKFDIMSSTWEYLAGNLSSYTYADYGSPYPYPGDVFSPTMVLDSTDSYLYVFGGLGYGDGGSTGWLNDVWIYSTQNAATTSSLSSEISQPMSSIDSVDVSSQQDQSTESYLTSEVSQSTSEQVNIIDNDNISNTTIIDGDVIFIDMNDDGTDNMIIIDGSQISSTGSISIYTDIILQGDATITTSKCISAFNSSKIIIDLSKRTKPENGDEENEQVISYSCLSVPDLDVELQGSYADGCIPKYEVQQASLILIFDTDSCQNRNTEQSEWITPVIIGCIILVCIVIGVILIVVFTNEDIRKKIFSNRTTDTVNEEQMTNLTDKMKLVDIQIESTNAQVDRLNNILDE